MYLLIDECCGKGLVAIAVGEGHAVQRTIEVAELGKGASDPDIFTFCATHQAVLVTINQGDFIALARQAAERPGLLLLPSLRAVELARLFKAIARKVATIFDATPNAIVKIEANGDIRRLE